MLDFHYIFYKSLFSLINAIFNVGLSDRIYKEMI